MPDVTRTAAATKLMRRLHAGARRVGLTHDDLRDLAPMLLGEQSWDYWHRSLAKLPESHLRQLCAAVEGWEYVTELRRQKGLSG